MTDTNLNHQAGRDTNEKETTNERTENSIKDEVLDKVEKVIDDELKLFPANEFLVSTRTKLPKDYDYIKSWNDAFFHKGLKTYNNFKSIVDRDKLILDGTVDLTDIPRGVIIIMGDPHTGKSSVDIKLSKYLVNQAKHSKNSWHIPFLEPISDIKKIIENAPFKKLSEKDLSLPVISIDSITSHIYNLNKTHVAMSGGINLSAIKEKLAIFDIYADKKDCYVILTVNTLGMDEKIKEAIITASKSISVLTLDLNRGMINYRTTNMKDRFEGKWSRIDVINNRGDKLDTIFSAMIDFMIADNRSGSDKRNGSFSDNLHKETFKFVQFDNNDIQNDLNIKPEKLHNEVIQDSDSIINKLSGSVMSRSVAVQKFIQLLKEQNLSLDEYFLKTKDYIKFLFDDEYTMHKLYREMDDLDEQIDALIALEPFQNPNTSSNAFLLQLMLSLFSEDNDGLFEDFVNQEDHNFSDLVDYLANNNRDKLAELDQIMNDPE